MRLVHIFISLVFIDTILTIIGVGWGWNEVNPLAGWVIDNLGVLYLLPFKMLFLAFALIYLEVLRYLLKPELFYSVLLLICVIVSLPVVANAIQIVIELV